MNYNDLSTYMYCITCNTWKDGRLLEGGLWIEGGAYHLPVLIALWLRQQKQVFLVSLLFRKVRKEGGDASFEMDA